ncbi:MAG: hypothetical protein ACLPVF_18755, partial [Acidimicrobiales bacterium]
MGTSEVGVELSTGPEAPHIPLIHPDLNGQVDSSRYTVDVVGSASIHSAPTRDGSVTHGAWLWRFPG